MQQAASSSKQARAKWANYQNSFMVLWIRLNFWWMMRMGVKDIHTKCEQETQWWWRKWVWQVADLGFKNCRKISNKNAPFWLAWVPRMCMDGTMRIGTNPHDD